jgi:hypothetical protein
MHAVRTTAAHMHYAQHRVCLLARLRSWGVKKSKLTVSCSGAGHTNQTHPAVPAGPTFFPSGSFLSAAALLGPAGLTFKLCWHLPVLTT